MTPTLLFAALLLQSPAPQLTTTATRPLGTLREQAVIQQQWLQYRLDSVLPRLMRQNGVEMWIIAMREYNEDPIFWSLVSPTTLFARRRTIYVFTDRGDRGVERLALGGGSQGGVYDAYVARDTVDPSIGRRPELVGQGQWDLLARLVRERDPKTIAVDISHTHAFSDGLSAGEWEQLSRTLPPGYLARVVRAERLPLDYQSIRAPGMLPVYTRLMEVVWAVIDTAFSNKVITPGTTTTDDVVWWMRQRVNDLGLGTWFHTDVDVQRRGQDLSASADAVVIQRGDVLHCDFGITALGLNTDTQHMGYVLRAGERDAPEGLKRALLNSNRLQDVLLAEMRPGRTGNDVLASALGAMRGAGINGTIYTHPIGDRGHGAGPLIGLWDHQEGVPGRGDVPLLPATWFSIELQATTPVPEWGGQPVRSAQEEDAELGADGTMRWILRRQTAFHLVR
ncbi:MAG: M24 family metallopeptidase [Gemmatimonadales bacterium]